MKAYVVLGCAREDVTKTIKAITYNNDNPEDRTLAILTV